MSAAVLPPALVAEARAAFSRLVDGAVVVPGATYVLLFDESLRPDRCYPIPWGMGRSVDDALDVAAACYTAFVLDIDLEAEAAAGFPVADHAALLRRQMKDEDVGGPKWRIATLAGVSPAWVAQLFEVGPTMRKHLPAGFEAEPDAGNRELVAGVP